MKADARSAGSLMHDYGAWNVTAQTSQLFNSAGNLVRPVHSRQRGVILCTMINTRRQHAVFNF